MILVVVLSSVGVSGRGGGGGGSTDEEVPAVRAGEDVLVVGAVEVDVFDCVDVACARGVSVR